MSYMDVTISSASAEWASPAWLVDQLAAEFGPFDLDPCATAANAKAPAYYTADDDGLAQPWKGRVFMNSPYGTTIGRWIGKAVAEVAAGRAELVVALLPVRADTRWFREATSSASLVRYWPGRIEFGAGGRAPFASAVMTFGRLDGRHGTTPATCKACKRVYWPARSDHRGCSRTCRRTLESDQVSPVNRSRR